MGNNNLQTEKILTLMVSLVIGFFLLHSFALAVVLPKVYFESLNRTFAPDSEFTVDIVIDSDKPINAIDLGIKYPADNLELLQINNSKSIVDVWTSSPLVSSSGMIVMQGGLSKAFLGQGGQIATLYFKAKKEGAATLHFDHINAYYADGLGTRGEFSASLISLNVSSSAQKIDLPAQDDTTSPSILTVEVVQDPITKVPLAIFNAIDKESGLKAVYLRSKKWLFWGDWNLVQNPAPIDNASWVMQIKAVDNTDNITLQTVYIKSGIMAKIPYMLLFALMVLAAIFLWIKMSNFHNKKNDGIMKE